MPGPFHLPLGTRLRRGQCLFHRDLSGEGGGKQLADGGADGLELWNRHVLDAHVRHRFVVNGKPITAAPVEADKRREDRALILF